MARLVVGITGASGIVLGYRTVEVLLAQGHEVHLVMTKDAGLTAALEIDPPRNTLDGFLGQLPDEPRERLYVHKIKDFSAPIASGSFQTDGMVVVPCSMATLSAVAMGLCDNLLRRAADVTLKERRRLVIVPREAPFSEIHLENMLKIARCGGTIVPPIPGWYTKHETLQEAEDFIVGRMLDSLGVDNAIYPRWEGVK